MEGRAQMNTFDRVYNRYRNEVSVLSIVPLIVLLAEERERKRESLLRT